MKPLQDQAEKKVSNFTTKGIQTMLRLTSENHMKLSDMADGKANILISVNAIIISVILSVLLRRLQVDTYLTIPTYYFLISSVITIVVAILATRPKVSMGTFSEQDMIDKKTNLFFFGNFYNCSQDDYEKAMSKMMVDPEYLYGSLVKDIYHLGVVLGRKYKLISWAYNIFMIGIVISVIAFAIAVMFSSGRWYNHQCTGYPFVVNADLFQACSPAVKNMKVLLKKLFNFSFVKRYRFSLIFYISICWTLIDLIIVLTRQEPGYYSIG